MKPPRIEFAPHRSKQGNFIFWLVLLLASAGAVLGVVMGNVYAHTAKTNEAQAQELLAEQDSLDNAVRQQEQIPAETVESVNAAVRMLNYPSIELLAQLERHATPNVQLISVELGPVRTNLRLVVQAGAATQVLDYMDALKHEPGFHDIALTRQEVMEGANQGSWRFTLEVAQAEAVARATAPTQRRREE
ncbi:hypothetical protein [Uliginosibacterium gangwonense]|uniref:hypothetical protein n=1 Tax=Uliginosibacterium gangwonense TaxID=392736 RepID=UPI00036964B3|nr:hypothetical protein [Uliginosibacterium gangwonense]